MTKWLGALAGVAAASLLGACEITVTDDPWADTYEYCGTTSDCLQTQDQCLGITPAAGYESAMCSHACSSDLECSYGGLCLSFDWSTPLCYEPCVDSFDCTTGFFCANVPGYGNACLPDGYGS